MLGMMFVSLFLAGLGMIYANETAAKNREAQKEINAENIALAREQMDRQDAMQIQNQTWQEMMYEKSNEYNTPANQMLRAESAGLNPWSVFSKGGASTLASNVPQSSSSGVSYPGLPNLGVPMATDYSQFLQGISGNVSQLAQSYKSLADAKKAGVETNQIETLLDEQLQGLSLENAQKKFNLDMDMLYVGKERNQKLMNLKSENSLLVQQALTSAQQGLMYDFESQLKKIEANLLQSKIDKGYVDIYIDNLKREGTLLTSQAKNADASAKNQNAQADESKARTEGIKLENAFSREAWTFKLDQVIDASTKAYHDSKISKEQSKMLHYEAEMARKANNKWEQTYWINRLNETWRNVNGSVDAIIPF